ncbi:MAG: GIY-YIG nuclease family protein [Candidatus Nanohaloarchaea archaeon]|nr:GIY-YIG nuclease family protein [Candidatus Nanohaloarchaea archaeon]
MAEGSYALLIAVDGPREIEVGALGGLSFDGWYVYSGSAFGPGGFARIDRHRESFADGVKQPHWHIDYLADNSATELAAVYATEGEDIECRVARSLPGEPVPDFGCSDCDCRSHLVAGPRSELEAALERLHDDRRFK